MSKPAILLYDIETSPSLGYVWGKYEQTVLEFTKEWELLSFAFKWAGERAVRCFARPDFKDKTERSLVEKLHTVMGSADVIIGHNSDQFDNKKARAKFVEHGLAPLPPITSIDTKKMAKSQFMFNSNSLNDLGQLLKLGKKIPTGGFDLWMGCMRGDASSWRTMKDYNKQDVVLLEKVYNRLKTWDTRHPSLSGMGGNPGACPVCSSNGVQSRGFSYARVSRRKRYQCTNCGHWYSGAIERLKGEA